MLTQTAETTLADTLGELAILDALNRLPDGAALTTEEAAAFLRLSPTTMERMRLKGNGPKYVQSVAKGAKGSNQRCTYLKSDLIAWQNSNRVTDSMAAAARRGHAFMPYLDPTPKRSLYDLVTRRPFYIDQHGQVAGSLAKTQVITVLVRLGSWRIDWLNPIAAVDRVWRPNSGLHEYAIDVSAALQAAQRHLSFALRL